jgi:two-component system, OmpR family, response regulator RegX3
VTTVRRPQPGPDSATVRVRQRSADQACTGTDLWQPAVVRILVVEDDDAVAASIVDGLERNGFAVERASTAAEALAAAAADLVLLDLGLPDRDGEDVCRRIRAASRVPIIVVSARRDEIDRVVLLELGADDYLVKPFGLRELIARVRAVLRRVEAVAEPEPTLHAGALELDPRSRRATAAGEPVELTPKEFDLLALLMSEPGRVFRRQEILERVWDPHWYGPSKTIDVHLASIRKKLGATLTVTAVRGVGFRVEP